MKAVIHTQYGPADVLQLNEVTKPLPRPNEVLIKIFASSVTATDPISRKGEPFIARTGNGFKKPKNAIPGGMLSGEIEDLGKEVKLFKKGDKVFGATGLISGAHAEYICLPEDAALAIKPNNITFEEAAGICDGGLTALSFLRDHGKIQRGQKILINGASGSIGTAAVQLAKYFGAEVTGVCSGKNVEMVKSLGADEVIDYTKKEFTKTDKTYDIIFDAIGKSSFSQCKSALKQRGIYLTTVPTMAILPQMLWTSLFGNKKAVFAATGLRPASEKAKDLNFIKGLIEDGKMKTVLDRRYPLSQIVEAHKYVEEGHKMGNVILTIQA